MHFNSKGNNLSLTTKKTVQCGSWRWLAGAAPLVRLAAGAAVAQDPAPAAGKARRIAEKACEPAQRAGHKAVHAKFFAQALGPVIAGCLKP